LKPLYQQGLVADTKASGTRNSRLELTEVGRETLARAKHLWAEAQESVRQKLGEDGLRSLKEALDLLEAL
jgi:DNA-binding MarR family transcriptional regulator